MIEGGVDLIQLRGKERSIDELVDLAAELHELTTRSSTLLIANDSGPMHVAAAAGTPVVALFGPTSAARTGPYGVGHEVLTGKVPCSPCFSRTCHNTLPLECLRLVSPEQVLAAARARRSLTHIIHESS